MKNIIVFYLLFITLFSFAKSPTSYRYYFPTIYSGIHSVYIDNEDYFQVIFSKHKYDFSINRFEFNQPELTIHYDTTLNIVFIYRFEKTNNKKPIYKIVYSEKIQLNNNKNVISIETNGSEYNKTFFEYENDTIISIIKYYYRNKYIDSCKISLISKNNSYNEYAEVIYDMNVQLYDTINIYRLDKNNNLIYIKGNIYSDSVYSFISNDSILIKYYYLIHEKYMKLEMIEHYKSSKKYKEIYCNNNCNSYDTIEYIYNEIGSLYFTKNVNYINYDYEYFYYLDNGLIDQTVNIHSNQNALSTQYYYYKMIDIKENLFSKNILKNLHLHIVPISRKH